MNKKKVELPTTTRSPEYIDKIWKDEKTGVPLEGKRFLNVYEPESPTGALSTELMFHKGKVHGDPAIFYPDGLEETWENGKFVKVSALPYPDRE
jgi:hypothetical protein